MTPTQLAAAAMSEPPAAHLTRYQMLADLLVLRGLGLELSTRQLGERWGVSHTTAHRICGEASALAVEVRGE